MKIGLEVEFWVVDEAGRLTDGRDLADVHDRVKPEFVGPMVEVQTAPHESERELEYDLRRTLERLLEAAADTGRALVPLGTPLTTASPSAISERGELFEIVYGDDIECAKNCAGTHVHFEQGEAADQVNLLTALDPAVALTSSSPYYCGERLMASSRAYAYRRECGPRFQPYCDLWGYAESTEGWERRVDECFETFVDLAVERGASREAVTANFRPENAVLTPVRLRRELPTVEWRAPDCALPSQVLQLVGDVARLVRLTEDRPVVVEDGPPGVYPDRIRVPPFERLRAHSDEAIRWGVHSERVESYLEAMTFDTESYRPISSQVRGPGKLREREARKIRLEYAARLREDVQMMAARTPSESRVGEAYVHV